ncbi:hypothetical protein PIROE2DRAFT_11315 [Piromyces sp. E2]|nr:hypothetical protein PIROE2DRAFT_11315 [Piromyces sp. E2]|eukprot:OUM62408.1 hypothetical protein PIROE2DRAFT_11315 [Piromyces sp. E2]
MAENTKQTRSNLIHYLDDDEIENELTFNEDGQVSDEEFTSNHQFNRNNQFKRRKLFNNLDVTDSSRAFDNISPISFAPNLSSLNKNNKHPFAVQSSINNNKRKNNTLSSSYFNDSQEYDVNRSSYEVDANEPFMPAHKSIKIDTNSDAITSPVASASTSPVFTSTPIAISTPNPRRTVNPPVRSSTPILPSSLLKFDGSFSSLSSISSINRSKNDSNLSSIREDFNSASEASSSSLSSSSNLNENLTSNDIIPTSTPISKVKQSNEIPPVETDDSFKDIDDVKDIYSTEKLMNSKLIINLPSSVRNKNLYWNLGISPSDSPYSLFAKEINEKNSILSPYRSPILKNGDNTFESSDYSPSPLQKQNKYESTGNELVLFKPIPWKQPLQDSIENSFNKSTKNNILTNDLMIMTNNEDTPNQDSFGNVNNISNSSTPTSATITNKLPLLSLSKSPDKSNNSFSSSNPIPINQNNNSVSRMNTSTMSPISPISPISLSMMNVDNSLLAVSNSSPTNHKEIDIPYSQDIPRLYGGNISSSSSFSTSPSPLTSSALMNGISRNNTELQSTIKNYKPKDMNNELNKTTYSDLFDYKDDFPPTELHDNDTIPTTTSNIQKEVNGNQTSCFGADSMDVDF